MVSFLNTVIAMLRGVNVGGRNKLPMSAFRTLCESLDLQNPQTYIQSGNVVFRTRQRNMAAVADRIAGAIEQTFGFRPEVIVRSIPELKQVIAASPFADRPGIDGSKLLVTFLSGDPHVDGLQKFHAVRAEGEELHLIGRELYMYFRDGMGRSKMAVVPLDRALKVSGTGRNWNTVCKLLEMAESLPE